VLDPSEVSSKSHIRPSPPARSLPTARTAPPAASQSSRGELGPRLARSRADGFGCAGGRGTVCVAS
jgi:hypothetical protein